MNTQIQTTSRKCQNRLRHETRVMLVGVRPRRYTWCITTAIQIRPLATCRPWVATSAKNADR